MARPTKRSGRFYSVSLRCLGTESKPLPVAKPAAFIVASLPYHHINNLLSMPEANQTTYQLL